MEGKLFFRMVLILLCCCAASQATSKTFTSDGTVQTGEMWGGIFIYDTAPNHTTVTMTGGAVTDSMGVYDSATFNMSGGTVFELGAHKTSNTNVSGGRISELWGCENSITTLSENGTILVVIAQNSSIFNMNGGTVDRLGASNYSVINIAGGEVSNCLGSSLGTQVNVFGYSLAKSDTGGTYGNGQVTGFWQDGTPFAINLSGSDTYSTINLIPEPATLALFGISGIFFRS